MLYKVMVISKFKKDIIIKTKLIYKKIVIKGI